MEREELLLQFREEKKQMIENYQMLFSKNLLEQAEKLGELVIENLKLLNQKVKEQKKEPLMFLYFALLKVDVIQKKYQILVQAQDFRWYFDDKAIEFYVPIDFLFESFQTLWEQLYIQSKKYVGKVSVYDVREIMFEELKKCQSSIAHVLRYLLRNVEKEEWFLEIFRTDYYVIRWGEYRDEAEILLRVDKKKKDQKEWEKELKNSMTQKENMVFSYWYQMELQGVHCEEVEMEFMTLEDCELKEVVFYKVNLSQASFLNSHFINCKFLECELVDASFSGSSFQDTCFEKCELTNTIFSSGQVNGLGLTQEELAVILVQEEE